MRAARSSIAEEPGADGAGGGDGAVPPLNLPVAKPMHPHQKAKMSMEGLLPSPTESEVLRGFERGASSTLCFTRLATAHDCVCVQTCASLWIRRRTVSALGVVACL
jgi:hypothetical protein